MHAEDLNDSMPGLPPVKRGPAKFRCGDTVMLVDHPQNRAQTRLKFSTQYVVEAVQFPGARHEAVWLEGYSEVIPFGAWRFEHSEPVSAEHPPEDAFEAPATVPLSSIDQAVFENLTAHEATVGPIPDNVTLPKHYARFKIEPIRFICENGLDFFAGNIVKYVLRHDAKNGLEDLRKAKRYLEMLIKFTEGNPDWWKAD